MVAQRLPRLSDRIGCKCNHTIKCISWSFFHIPCKDIQILCCTAGFIHDYVIAVHAAALHWTRSTKVEPSEWSQRQRILRNVLAICFAVSLHPSIGTIATPTLISDWTIFVSNPHDAVHNSENARTGEQVTQAGLTINDVLRMPSGNEVSCQAFPKTFLHMLDDRQTQWRSA